MRKLLTAVFVLALPIAANATSCVAGPWSSEHKTLHFVTTAIYSSVTTAVTKEPTYGVAVGLLAGASREVYKIKVGARCEWASIAYDVAGSLTGAYLANHFYVEPQKGGLKLSYERQF